MADFDVLIVGVGFSGVYALHLLRKQGFTVQCVEANSGIGGVWQSNRYPGLRVDIEVPHYQLAIDELWKDWTWSNRFPERDELCRYSEYVDKKWDLSRSIKFNTTVTQASFDDTTKVWTTTTDKGDTFKSSFLVLSTGYGSKPYIPALRGLETFKGICHHTARWPEGGVEVEGKRVGIVGTGATGVQIIQEIGPKVSSLTIFQRTPNHALPMIQRPLSKEEQDSEKTNGVYATHYERRKETFSGSGANFTMKMLSDTTPEERRAHYEDLWTRGGLHFWDCNYGEVFANITANNEAYAFWRDKVLARVKNPLFQQKLAPEVPAHAFGAKRPSLEISYYEVFNQDNVTLVDTNENPIGEVTEKGVVLTDGTEIELDVLILATGFDAISGGITNIDIRGASGISIKEKWKNGIYTYLGLMTHDFPNLFILYGPQSPCPFSIGPASAEVQGEWLSNTLTYLRQNKITRIEPTTSAEQDWRKATNDIWKTGLWAETKSWYAGSNIPGKVNEALAYAGSLPMYKKLCNESAEKGYEGFVLS